MDRFIYSHCLKCVPMKATCEREIFKLFQVTKCKGFFSFKLEKNTKKKNFKTEYLLCCKKNNAFNMKTVFMKTVDRKLGSSQCNQ